MNRYLISPTNEQDKIVKAFLEALDISFIKEEEEALPDYVLKGIAEGQEDIRAGRFITLEEFEKRVTGTK